MGSSPLTTKPRPAHHHCPYSFPPSTSPLKTLIQPCTDAAATAGAAPPRGEQPPTSLPWYWELIWEAYLTTVFHVASPVCTVVESAPPSSAQRQNRAPRNESPLASEFSRAPEVVQG